MIRMVLLIMMLIRIMNLSRVSMLSGCVWYWFRRVSLFMLFVVVMGIEIIMISGNRKDLNRIIMIRKMIIMVIVRLIWIVF